MGLPARSLGFAGGRWISLDFFRRLSGMSDDEERFDGWALVAAQMQRELDRSGGSVRALSGASGVDARTITKLLEGKPVTRRPALVRLANHLGWPADGFDRMLRGDAPSLEVEAEWRREQLERANRRLQELEVADRVGSGLDEDGEALLLHWAQEVALRSSEVQAIERQLRGDASKPDGDQAGNASSLRDGDPLGVIVARLDEMRSMLQELLDRDASGGGRNTP